MSQIDTLQFARAFIRHPGRIGAIAPSSPALARAMIAGLSIGQGEMVAEFGPGTGSFTAAIREILPTPGSYLGIERCSQFVQRLRQRFPELCFVEASAEHADALHWQMNLPPVKAVLCGLPFASLPTSVQDGVIRSLDQLIQPGSQFRTFQYVHAYALPAAVRFRRRMNALFGRFTRTRAVLRNLPPAFVLQWQR